MKIFWRRRVDFTGGNGDLFVAGAMRKLLPDRLEQPPVSEMSILGMV